MAISHRDLCPYAANRQVLAQRASWLHPVLLVVTDFVEWCRDSGTSALAPTGRRIDAKIDRQICACL